MLSRTRGVGIRASRAASVPSAPSIRARAPAPAPLTRAPTRALGSAASLLAKDGARSRFRAAAQRPAATGLATAASAAADKDKAEDEDEYSYDEDDEDFQTQSAHPMFLPQQLAFTDDVLEFYAGSSVASAFHASVREGTVPDKATRNAVAKAIYDWAAANGAVNFSHWAHPLRGPMPLQKFDSFMELEFSAEGAHKPMKSGFGGSRLFQAETDGSSFPNGGLRQTHRAAAYMAWDRTSPPFIRGDTVYIPSAFVSWNGHALDEKTPLLRSQAAVARAGRRLLRLVPGFSKEDQAAGVVCNVGWEQEFFLVDREHYLKRPDLVAAGRTVLGAPAPRGQQTSANYFAPMHERAKRILEELQSQLLAVGCPFAVYHNEVAPAQHEFSPIFRVVNVALDHNVLAMDMLRDIAVKNGMVALTHEKPFQGVNGSGKHLNWGLNAGASGRNLFVPGDTDEEQASFMVFVAALTRAVNAHGDKIRAAVASAGNDHRLGAHEAPPAIISLYLGEEMMKHVDAVVDRGAPLAGYGKSTKSLAFGAPEVAPVSASTEDRNRTAPFPFCGNRFELRAMGSDGSIALPLTVVQTAIAEAMDALAADVERGKPLRDAVADVFRENRRIIFNGNGYSKEWHEEAARRGIPNLKQSVDAYGVLASDSAKALFEKANVLTPAELDARVQVMYDTHVETVLIEANCMLDMLRSGVLPACAADLAAFDKAPQLAGERKAAYDELAALTAKLRDVIDAVPDSPDARVVAKYTQDVLRPAMKQTRAVADKCERFIPKAIYPYPSYHDMFFHPQTRSDDAVVGR